MRGGRTSKENTRLSGIENAYIPPCGGGGTRTSAFVENGVFCVAASKSDSSTLT